MHELPQHKTAIPISVELMRLHLVDLDASTQLIAQPPCLRHCHTSVHPILNSSKPKDRLSYSSVIVPWRFQTKTTQHVKSGIGPPAVWSCGSIHPNSKNNNIQSIPNIMTIMARNRNSQKSQTNQGIIFKFLIPKLYWLRLADIRHNAGIARTYAR